MKYLFLVVLAGCLVLMGHTQEPALTVKNFKSYPSYPLLSLDSTKTSSSALRVKGKPTVIVYFSPTCHHCQAFTEELTSHLKDFKGAHFVMVSAYPLADIKQFSTDYGITKLSNFSLAFDPDFTMGRFFSLKEIPGVFVYNKEGQLVKGFEGTAPLEKLLEAINTK